MHHSAELIRNLYKSSADFFSLDNECKSRVALTPQHPYGYEASEILSYTYNTEGNDGSRLTGGIAWVLFKRFTQFKPEIFTKLSEMD